MNQKIHPFVTPPSVVAQITQLPSLDMAAIKAMWKRLFGGDAPTHNRQFLERRIAYKLQLIEFRKVDRNMLESNQRRIETLVERGKLLTPTKHYIPPIGSVLTRLYQDVEHRVTIEAEGTYEYQGRRYNNLSVIAREITSTRWSGPLFFGLRQNQPVKKSKKVVSK